MNQGLVQVQACSVCTGRFGAYEQRRGVFYLGFSRISLTALGEG